MQVPFNLTSKFTFSKKLGDVKLVAEGAAWRYGLSAFTASSFSDMLDVIQSDAHHPIFEQLIPKAACKMYFDVEQEFKEEPSAEEKRTWLHGFLTPLKRAIGLDDPNKIFVTNGSRPYNGVWKASWHVTCPDLIVGRNNTIINVARRVNQELPPTHKVLKNGKLQGCIDETVYKDNQCMRTVNAKKPAKHGEVIAQEWLRPWDVVNDCEIVFESAEMQRSWFSNSLITNVPQSQTHTPMEITQVSVSPPNPQETQVVPAPRPPPPAALDEDTRSRARMLASQVKPDSFEDWSMLGFALYTIFGGSDEGLYLFLSLWSGRPMFDEVKARRCYRIAEGKLGMGYLMRKAYSPPVPLFSPEHLCSLTAPIKSEIASLGKDEVAKLAALQKDLETISVDYLNQFFLVIVDEKPIICREVGKGLKQTKYAEAVNVNWACIKREFKLWNESPGRRSFQGLTFDPSVIGHTTCEGEPYYNLYKGPEHPYDPDYDMSNCEANIKPLIDHMFKILCDGNKEEFNYLLKWCANAVQNPSKPNRVAVVLQGAQGCGKGIFVNKFKDIYGKAYFYQVMDQQSFLGTFAPENMEQCLTCFVDEAFFPGNMRDVQIIKKLVTEESREIEKKYGSRRSFKNYTNYIFASNSHYVVHNDPQERRFFVIKPNNRYAGVSSAATDAYIQSVLDVPTADFAQYLYRVDLTGFNARNFPRTEGSKQQKQHTLNPVGTWWDSVLREGYIPNLVDFRLPDRQAVSTVAMFKTFTDWHKDSKQPGRMTSGMPQFTILFMEFLTIRGEKEPICRKMRKKQDGDAKVNMWQFPPLEALKKCFAQHMDVPTWFDDDEPGSTNEPAPKRHRSSSPVRPPLSETPPTVAHYPFTAPPRQPPPLPPKTSPAARPDPVVMDIERDTIARYDKLRELTGECPYSN